MFNTEHNVKMSDSDNLTSPEIRELASTELAEVAGGDYKIEFETPRVSLVLVGENNFAAICVRVGTNFGCIANHGGQIYWSGGPVSGPVRGGRLW